MPLKQSIGFLGAGKMATALARGIVDAGLSRHGRITASDIVPAARKAFAREVGARVTASNAEVFEKSNIVVLAVKPHQVEEVFAGIRDVATRKHLVISIVAGLQTQAPVFSDVFGPKVPFRFIRVMPNTPALVGEGAAGFCLGANARAADGRLAERILGGVGLAVEVPERLMDAVTGLSGSGPAYIFEVIESLSDGGVHAGLPRELSTKLAAQMVMGAAKMVLETGRHPGDLKDMVASPGGTTIEGLRVLEEHAVRAAFINAVCAAAERSRQLGED
ncbi:MAG: pyrroline-5-carboxylate reductase [Verrucomicrobiales bacterium]|nr:pyrroline-5-carboxylate reductase [Verrucomicrobiales bacterium]